MTEAQTRQMVDVDRGLFLLRYVSADDAAFPPVVRVSPAAGCGQDIRFLLHPDEGDAVLRQPESCLVIRAEMQGRLALDVAPARRNGSVAARITIEALSKQTPDRMALAPPRLEPLARPRRSDDIALIGHLAGRGDVAVKAGEWLAGPKRPSRIEGFRVDWRDQPDDLTLRYAAKTGRPHPGSGTLVETGSFVGSRGKSLPLVGLVLEMAGPGAAGRRFSAEMAFLGAPLLRLTGPRIAGAGPTGREPLVGLRVTIEDQPGDHGRPPALRADPPSRANRRVSIFRSEAAEPRAGA